MKRRLLTPGPVPAPPETLLELAQPIIHHRTAESRRYLTEVLDGLKHIYQTKNDIIPLTSSGTGGLEAAVANCIPKGKKAICLISGRFGERWRSLCQAFGVEPISVTVPYGDAVAPEQLERALADHPDAAAVCSTLSETSTGVGNDIAAFGAITAKTGALLLVDAISGLAAMECRTDDWNIDVCVAGSQKALMMPPGLAFLSVSDKAWKAVEANPNRPVFYFDLLKAKAKLGEPDTPFTPAHTLIRAMRINVKKICDEGIENVWRRQAITAKAARAAMTALGLMLFAKRPADGLTVVEMPDGMSSNDLLKRLEDRYGMKLANGQVELKGKIFRLAHMGELDQFDTIAAISAIELVLLEMGHPVEPGTGVAAAQRVLAENAMG